VPLYQLFCQVTGFAGTTQRADALPDRTGAREFVISFNADIASDLPWKFKPLQREVTVKSGEQKLVAYKAENSSDHVTHGTATYNVTPLIAGAYFNKIECFCFEQQTLPAGKVVNMPISFFLDPEIENDPDLKDVRHITLSYTFFNDKNTR